MRQKGGLVVGRRRRRNFRQKGGFIRQMMHGLTSAAMHGTTAILKRGKSRKEKDRLTKENHALLAKVKPRRYRIKNRYY